MTDAPLHRTGPGGSIYDLGYQGYEGPRLGRQAAIRALFWHTVRSCYGIGRCGRAKIAPITLSVLALLPAIVGVGIAALAAQTGTGEFIDEASPIRYDSYHGMVSTLVGLFCAAQAPELLGRDQRYSVLPIYFSRALARLDYTIAKILGLIVSLLVLVLVPYLVLFVGRVFVAPDPISGFTTELPSLPPIVAQALLVSTLLGSLSMAISAFTPRRAFATAGIIAALIIPPIIVAIVHELTRSDIGSFLVLLSPPDVLDGTNAMLFDVRSESPAVQESDFGALAFIGAAVVGAAIAVGLTIRRYLRIAV